MGGSVRGGVVILSSEGGVHTDRSDCRVGDVGFGVYHRLVVLLMPLTLTVRGSG
jgi:hypothetical protein